MVFLTMGTGLGAGVITNGLLLSGASGQAGEIGHVRLTASGPVGYNKAGSVEGWASGAGMAQVAARGSGCNPAWRVHTACHKIQSSWSCDRKGCC